MQTVFMVPFYWSYAVFVLLQELDIYQAHILSLSLINKKLRTVFIQNGHYVFQICTTIQIHIGVSKFVFFKKVIYLFSKDVLNG